MKPRPVRQENGPALAGSAGRLSDLLTTFSVLHRDGQALLGQIRGSLRELRELRQELRKHSLAVNSNGQLTRHSYLQLEYGLTAREADVALLLGQGRSNRAIAASLKISDHTARHHTQRILSKLGPLPGSRRSRHSLPAAVVPFRTL